MKLLSVAELLKEDTQRRMMRKVILSKKHITIKDGSGDYVIERSRITTPGQALDWIHQISEKSWAWEDPQIMEDFLEVLFEVIPSEWWAFKG